MRGTGGGGCGGPGGGAGCCCWADVTAPAISRIAKTLFDRDMGRPPSGRLETDAGGERTRDDELSIVKLERQRRQRPRRFAGDDLGAVFGIELRAVAGAMQQLLVRQPVVNP